MFIITKMFVSGPLEGIAVTEKTSVQMEVGKIYKPCAGGSAYKVTSCELA